MVVNKFDVFTSDNSDLQEGGNQECNSWELIVIAILTVVLFLDMAPQGITRYHMAPHKNAWNHMSPHGTIWHITQGLWHIE